MLSSFQPEFAPTGYVEEIGNLASVEGYWTLPGPRRSDIASHKTYYGANQEDAIEEAINSRHLDDYNQALQDAPLEDVIRAGVGCIILLRERLTSLNEKRPFNFRLSASEYALEPELWPISLTFSRYRGSGDDLHLSPRSNAAAQLELDAKSFELLVRL